MNCPRKREVSGGRRIYSEKERGMTFREYLMARNQVLKFVVAKWLGEGGWGRGKLENLRLADANYYIE